MMSRLLTTALVLLLQVCAVDAHAAIQDFVNSKMVGKAVQPAKLAYYNAPPAAFDNKVVLIDFWAVWCEPCRHSVPALNRLHAEFADKGLLVLGMTRDSDTDIAEFVKRIPMHFPIATDVDGAYFKRMGVRAMPYAVLADRNGIIIWQGDPEELTQARVEAALAAPSKTAAAPGR